MQGLRTIAVMAVVLYHFWPNRVTGGYVGVDVFFVISGYLITGHMFREIHSTGSMKLTAFWARRIRRLLPAAFLVLIVSLAGVFLWAPETVWESTARQVTASALYVQNWILAADSVDYSAMNADATVAQHYWSLSIEEQFYVVWPVLLMGLLAAARLIARRRGRTLRSRAVLIGGLGTLGAASLVYSVIETAVNPPAAYFVTPGRIWEFAIGALVALIFVDRRIGGVVGQVLMWCGLAAVIWTAFRYSDATPFPGYTALLPVLGTAAVLACQGGSARFGAAWWLSCRPAVFLGDVSYAVYLWHWPLVVLVPYVLGRVPTWPEKVGLVLLSVLLAWITKKVVEDPLRTGPLLRRRRVVYPFAAAGMVLVAGLSVVLVTSTSGEQSIPSADIAAGCYGPGALNPANACGPVIGNGPPVPGAVAVAKETTSPAYPGCQADADGTQLVSCDLGVPAAQAKKVVAIVGDSHATAWFPALDAIAKKRDWQLKTYTKSSCPVTTALRVLSVEKNTQRQSDCHSWVQDLDQKLVADTTISTVFTASYSSAYTYLAAPGASAADPAVDGFAQMWRQWRAAGKQVVVFDDVPRTIGSNVPTCLASHPNDPLACSVPRNRALPATMNITAAAKKTGSEITAIHLADQFCDRTTCYPIVGRMIVYRDYSHVSNEYARALVPYIEKQLP